jgi:hypothetical protein
MLSRAGHKILLYLTKYYGFQSKSAHGFILANFDFFTKSLRCSRFYFFQFRLYLLPQFLCVIYLREHGRKQFRHKLFSNSEDFRFSLHLLSAVKTKKRKHEPLGNPENYVLYTINRNEYKSMK